MRCLPSGDQTGDDGQHSAPRPHGKATVTLVRPSELRITRSRTVGSKPETGASPSTEATALPSGDTAIARKRWTRRSGSEASTLEARPAKASPAAIARCRARAEDTEDIRLTVCPNETLRVRESISRVPMSLNNPIRDSLIKVR